MLFIGNKTRVKYNNSKLTKFGVCVKKFVLLAVLALGQFGNVVYSNYYSFDSNRKSATEKYFNGEISTEEYVDSKIGPMNVPKSYQGKLQKHPYKAFGEGYRYSDSEGNQM